MKIAIGIVTSGRPNILARTTVFLNHQTREPDEFFICPANDSDISPGLLESSRFKVQLVESQPGASRQRNAILKRCNSDVIVFFDDDYLPCNNFILNAVSLFANDPAIAVATGHLLADGAVGPGIDFAEGEHIIDQAGDITAVTTCDTFSGYGCNMVVNMKYVKNNSIFFDENLPFYSWLEDVDFSREISKFGRIVKHSALRGVHLGHKQTGRSPGKRVGYSQIANRIYIYRKGNMTRFHVISGNSRNLASNLIKSCVPEPWVDRRGRLAGNLLAILDWFAGRLDPKRIVDIT